MHQICSTLNRGRPVAPLVLRVVIGGLFIWHGIDKFDVGISMIDLALLAGLVAVIVLGPGRLSLDHQVGIEPPRVIRVPRTRLRLTRP